MVGRQHDRGVQRIEPSEIAVEHRGEFIGSRRAGGGLVLDVVGGRQVHDVRTLPLEQRNAGGEDELGERSTVDGRHLHAGERQGVADTIVDQGDFCGLFRREADALQLVAEE